MDVIQIIGIESEALENEWRAKNGPAQMTLFDFDKKISPSKEVSTKLSVPYEKVMDTTVNNFVPRLQKLMQVQKNTRQSLMQAAHALLGTMSVDEKQKFNRAIIALGCNKRNEEGVSALENILKNLVQGTMSLNERQQKINNTAQDTKHSRRDDLYRGR